MALITLAPIVMPPVIVPPARFKNVLSVYVLVVKSAALVGVYVVVILLAPMSIAPVIVPPVKASLPASAVVTVVWKLASSLRAAANSLRVSRAPGAASTRLDMLVST